MKRVYAIAGLMGLLAAGAFAQDAQEMKMKAAQMKAQLEKVQVERMLTGAKVMALEGSVMGPPVKGAPYAADEVRENTQVLADGTRIHNESKTTVYRDGSGRVRRETPDEISIWDPNTGTNWVLHPKTMSAQKMTMNFTFTRSGSGIGTGTGAGTSTGGAVTATSTWRMTSEAQAGPNAEGGKIKIVSPYENTAVAYAPGGVLMTTKREVGKKESLGTQVVEGISSEGERVTNTVEAGAIGNDRPIQTVSERWYSPELQTVVLTKRSDPRSGEEVFKMVNIRRGEQSPSLFEVPAGYQTLGNK